jgi:Hint domain-containing protein
LYDFDDEFERTAIKELSGMKTRLAFLIVPAFILAACAPAGGVAATAVEATVLPATLPVGGATPPPLATPGPPTAIPSLPSAALPPSELKYILLARYPDFFFCDPDYYPIAREDEGKLALERFPGIQASVEEFQAILNHNGLGGLAFFSDDQKLLIYREHKKLAAIFFELAGDEYRFSLRTANQNQQGFNIQGSIDGKGKVMVLSREPAIATCPICLSVHTLVDTPGGEVAVEDLRPGDPVWTMDEARERVPAVILKMVRVAVPAGQPMVHVVLDDGRELWASPGHPTADGRRLGDLRVGDMLDGGRLALVETAPYNGLATFDLLPSGGTGLYWADGILMGSTLSGAPAAALPRRR